MGEPDAARASEHAFTVGLRDHTARWWGRCPRGAGPGRTPGPAEGAPAGPGRGWRVPGEAIRDPHAVGHDREGAPVPSVHEPTLGGQLEEVSVEGVEHDLGAQGRVDQAARAAGMASGPPRSCTTSVRQARAPRSTGVRASSLRAGSLTRSTR